MSQNNKPSSTSRDDFEDSGRSLPTTSTKTPMPEVKPPKQSDSSNNNKK